MAKRKIPSESATIRRKPVDPKGPYIEMLRASLAPDLASSRIGELKEMDYPRKVGAGDVREQDERRARGVKYSTKMLKEGKGGKGAKKYT
jgi:hypothetical protein